MRYGHYPVMTMPTGNERAQGVYFVLSVEATAKQFGYHA
jgi:hypothetical protein